MQCCRLGFRSWFKQEDQTETNRFENFNQSIHFHLRSQWTSSPFRPTEVIARLIEDFTAAYDAWCTLVFPLWNSSRFTDFSSFFCIFWISSKRSLYSRMNYSTDSPLAHVAAITSRLRISLGPRDWSNDGEIKCQSDRRGPEHFSKAFAFFQKLNSAQGRHP